MDAIELLKRNISNLNDAVKFMESAIEIGLSELIKPKIGHVAKKIESTLLKSIKMWPKYIDIFNYNIKIERLKQGFAESPTELKNYDRHEDNVSGTKKFAINYPTIFEVYIKFVHLYGDPDLLKWFIYTPEYTSILKNKEILGLFSRYSDKTDAIYIHLAAMEMGESMVPNMSSSDDHLIYDIEQVSNIFDLVDKSIFDDNMFAVFGDRGIYPIQTVMHRFNVMTDGIFNGIDLTGYHISGSSLLPCVAKNPLEKNFDIEFDKLNKCFRDKKYLSKFKDAYKFIAYLEYYYPSRNSLTDENVEIFDDGKYDGSLSDIDIFIQGSVSELDVKFHQLFDNLCKHNPKKNLKYRKIHTSKTTHRYRIYGKMHRYIEVFNNARSPLSVIRNFHVAPVRMLLTGSVSEPIVKILPSCAYSLLSGIYRKTLFVSCNKKIEHIWAKYILRGYAGIYVDYEKADIMKSLKLDEKQKGMFQEYKGGMLTKNCSIFTAKFLRSKLLKYPTSIEPDDSYILPDEYTKKMPTLSLPGLSENLLADLR